MRDAAGTSRAPLIALALAAFGIGTTEFVIMGLLPEVAADLGVGLPAAGLLVSGYALGVAFGGPLLAIALVRMPARPSLLALLGLFIAGNLGCALAPGYGALMVARIVTALCHAAFFGAGAVVAAKLAPEGREARAIALMISGLTLANVLGVPLGTLIGHAAGWRAPFLGVAAIGVLALLALARFLPSVDSQRDLAAEFRALTARPVWLTLAVSIAASASMFGFFTYVTPILTELAGVPHDRVSLVLLSTGLGLTMGNVIGARLADWRAVPSLIVVLVAVALVLLAMSSIGRTPIVMTGLIALWGALAFSVCAITQAMVVRYADAAPNLASTLNISAFNLGNAIGAGLGAAMLARGFGLVAIPVMAAAIALAASGIAFTLASISRALVCRGSGGHEDRDPAGQ